MMNKLLFALSLSLLLCVSCTESTTMKNVFYLGNDSIGGHKDCIVYDFNGEFANDSSLSQGYAFCRQQRLKNSDVFYGVFPEINYVGIYKGELVIRLFQHQQFMPSDVEPTAKPLVALGKIKNQKFYSVCGGLQVSLKGHAKVTALRISDNDTIDRLWGDYVVRNIGKENQQLFGLSSSDGNNEVWLDCPEGITLSEDTAMAFTFMLPAGACYRGFDVDVFCGDSLLYHAVTEKNLTIKRGMIFKMPELVIP